MSEHTPETVRARAAVALIDAVILAAVDAAQAAQVHAGYTIRGEDRATIADNIAERIRPVVRATVDQIASQGAPGSAVTIERAVRGKAIVLTVTVAEDDPNAALLLTQKSAMLVLTRARDWSAGRGGAQLYPQQPELDLPDDSSDPE